MELDLLELYRKNYSSEFDYRISKNGVLKIDTREINKSIPGSAMGAVNGGIIVNNFIIYYSPKKDFTGNDEFFFSSEEEGKTAITRIKVDVVSTFKPKAHILVLLGEELIKSPVMAIYELIKNSYDADSISVSVKFSDIENVEKAEIIITDLGTGITKEVLESVWFEPGTNFRKPIQEDGKRKIKRSPIFWRIPMGEKGVGRFAVHKLGHTINLISRPAKVEVDEFGKATTITLLDYELEVEIDWRTFSQSKYLEDVKIEWKIKTDVKNFAFQDTSGTKITIGNLKESWTRGMARQLKRNVLSMISPKNDSTKFKIILDFGNWWLNDFPEIDEILDESPYKVTALVDEFYNMTFEYHFELKNNPEIGTRSIKRDSNDETTKLKHERNIKGEIKKFYSGFLVDNENSPEKIEELINLFDSDTNKIPYGSIILEMYSYDLDSASLREYTSNPKIVKNILKDHAGIKVFKGDLRIYDYGDPGNDWLGLDIKRVNNKTWFSNNQNIGFVYLDDETSGALIEKTNREGFIKNEAYDHFVVLLEFLLTEFKAERQSDREKWLRLNKKGSSNTFERQINNFKSIIEIAGITNPEIKQNLINEAEKLEERYQTDKDTLLIPAGVGMTASFAMHEIEKLVPRIEEAVHEEPIKITILKDQVDELKDYVEGILSVVKRGGNKPISLIESINQAVKNYSTRIVKWNIQIVIEHEEGIETIKCDKRLLITMLMNVIDNSIYWLDTVYKKEKKILIKTKQMVNGISIFIVDNGPGFKDRIEDIVSPFFSRKEGGIGIGMYLIDTVMMQYGKLNIIFDREYLREKEIPEDYTGAAVELSFNKK